MILLFITIVIQVHCIRFSLLRLLHCGFAGLFLMVLFLDEISKIPPNPSKTTLIINKNKNTKQFY